MAIQPPKIYLDHLSRTWDNNIPTKFLWTVDFQSRLGTSMNSVADGVSKVLSDYDDRRFALKPGLLTDRTDDTLGYLFAQSIALPQEQLTVGTIPIQRSGGFVAGYYGDRRVDYGAENKLDITFLEQNKDIVDFFIRPWLIATSYYGLIEGGDVDLKCNIIVNLHTRNPDGPMNKDIEMGDSANLRKSYIFEDCVPIVTEGDQINQDGEQSNDDLTRTASFIFSKYKITEPPAIGTGGFRPLSNRS